MPENRSRRGGWQTSLWRAQRLKGGLGITCEADASADSEFGREGQYHLALASEKISVAIMEPIFTREGGEGEADVRGEAHPAARPRGDQTKERQKITIIRRR